METLQPMFNHMHWANQRIIEQLKQTDPMNEQALRLLSHVLIAERIWLTRLQQKDSSGIVLWETLSIEACEHLANSNSEGFSAFMASNIQLDGDCKYNNQSGTPFTTAIREILTHIALHGQYHRGQINFLLRTNSFEPINVDYITFTRENA